MKIIDLRSDTVTLPTKEMLERMAAAELGDDGRIRDGKGEDPTALRVEAMVAELLGKEGALFAPSGTMGNTLALLAHTRRGDKIIVSEFTHVYRTEKGVFDPDLFGRVPLLVQADGPHFDPAGLDTALAESGVKAIVLENTHNYTSGMVMTPEQIRTIAVKCRSRGIAVHIDGARIFNAAVALGVDVRDLVQEADSVMFCVSKGLCAPVGSFVAGSAEFINCVREIRSPLGGQMRQVGVLEAAAEIAVQTMSKRLHEDHRRARALAEGLKSLPHLSIHMEAIQTNLVRIEVPEGIAKKIVQSLESLGVRTGAVNDDIIRLVTHKDIDDDDIAAAIQAFRQVCTSL